MSCPGEEYAAPVFRFSGSVVVLVAFGVAAGAFSYRGVRLFAALLKFTRRTLFLYPHLESDLAGDLGDKRVLSRLVSAVDLPRPPSAGVVKEALSDDALGDLAAKKGPTPPPPPPLLEDDDDENATAAARHPRSERPPAPHHHHQPSSPRPLASSADHTWSLCSINTEDSDETTSNAGSNPSLRSLSNGGRGRVELPVLALGATDGACSFCSHDRVSDGVAYARCHATHAIPVCSSWAEWYLRRAERANRADRRRSELGDRGDRGADAAPAAATDRRDDAPTAGKPCCDFALLALERVALHRENASLRAQLARLQAKLEPAPPPED